MSKEKSICVLGCADILSMARKALQQIMEINESRAKMKALCLAGSSARHCAQSCANSWDGEQRK